MGRGRLTEDQIEQLKKNIYVADVDESRVIYTTDFKKRFIEEYLSGEKPKDIFRAAGFDPGILGDKRIERAASRWRELYKSGGMEALDTRKVRKEIRTRRTALLKKYENVSSRLSVANLERKIEQDEMEELKLRLESLQSLVQKLYQENYELKQQLYSGQIRQFPLGEYSEQKLQYQ